MKHLQKLLLAVCLLAPFINRAQNSYSFEQTTGTYASLIGGTAVPNPGFSSGDAFGFELTGETFWFYNKPFTFDDSQYMYFQTNGNIGVNAGADLVIVDGAFIFLDSIDNTSEIIYKIEGQSGNKIVKVEWKNLRIRTGQPDNFINAQIWVYQATGVIELRYGPSSASNANGFTEVGAKAGINAGMFYAKSDFSKMHQKLWLNGHPSSLTFDSTTQIVFRALAGVPPNGTVYRFVPRFSLVSAPEPLPVNLISLYPNPVRDVLHLPAELSGTIRDMSGKELFTFNSQSFVDVSQLEAGIYLLVTDDGAAAKFVK